MWIIGFIVRKKKKSYAYVLYTTEVDIREARGVSLTYTLALTVWLNRTDREFSDYKRMEIHLNQFMGSSSSIGARRIRNVCVAFRAASEQNNLAGYVITSNANVSCLYNNSPHFIQSSSTYRISLVRAHSNSVLGSNGFRCFRALEVLEHEYCYLKNKLHEYFQVRCILTIYLRIDHTTVYGMSIALRWIWSGAANFSYTHNLRYETSIAWRVCLERFSGSFNFGGWNVTVNMWRINEMQMTQMEQQRAMAAGARYPVQQHNWTDEE